MSVRIALCTALPLFAACAESTKSPVMPTDPSLAAKQSSNTDQIVDGSFGPGALYRLARPANWNGGLLVYAHGYVSPDQPIALPPEGDLLISLLTSQGFAVAFSSFSENEWAVKDGAKRTHQLLGIFTSQFGNPSRVYVGGASMGGLIAIKLTETYPNTYDGTLPACAVAAGLQGLLTYQANTRTLFDFFYPGVLPGTAAYLPPGTDITTGIIGPAAAALTANPIPGFTMALIDQTPLPGATPAELIQSIVTALAGNAGSLAELQTLTSGKPYFDNRSTNYSGTFLPAALLQAINGGVGRFTASPSARRTLDHNYTPSGGLRIPMLMLSNARDPVVPGFNQASYLSAVLAKEAANLLVQRQVPVYGHCVFTPTELGTAFADLVLWVEYGITPALSSRARDVQ